MADKITPKDLELALKGPMKDEIARVVDLHDELVEALETLLNAIEPADYPVKDWKKLDTKKLKRIGSKTMPTDEAVIKALRVMAKVRRNKTAINDELVETLEQMYEILARLDVDYQLGLQDFPKWQGVIDKAKGE